MKPDQTKDPIIKELIKNSPALSAASIKTYKSLLSGLRKKLNGNRKTFLVF